MTRARQAGLEVRFWGVRGSIPSPGPATARVGGNTSCVEVLGAGQRLILDGGSGLRQLAAQWGDAAPTGTLVVSHLHWDHVQGIPFFSPLYASEGQFTILGPPGLEAALRTQMAQPGFPVPLESLRGLRDLRELRPGDRVALGGLLLRCAALRHPGGCLGFRVDCEAASLATVYDHEQVPGAPADADLLAFVRGADLLLHDAQYLPEELPARRGWGHSSYVEAVVLARAAGVAALALTHHDPARPDRGLFALQARARRLAAGVRLACEGLRARVHAGGVAWTRAEAHDGSLRGGAAPRRRVARQARAAPRSAVEEPRA